MIFSSRYKNFAHKTKYFCTKKSNFTNYSIR